MKNENNHFLSNIIMDSIRILILIAKFNEKKSSKLNLNKIMLYDYYLKYPNTMIKNDNLDIDLKNNFYEYYSFYHWKPEIGNYRRVIHYLLSKGLIARKVEKKQFFYYITDIGLTTVNHLSSNYKNALDSIAEYIRDAISKKNDKEIEQDILSHTSAIERFEGDVNG